MTNSFIYKPEDILVVANYLNLELSGKDEDHYLLTAKTLANPKSAKGAHHNLLSAESLIRSIEIAHVVCSNDENSINSRITLRKKILNRKLLEKLSTCSREEGLDSLEDMAA
jgi:hypothetical protein